MIALAALNISSSLASSVSTPTPRSAEVRYRATMLNIQVKCAVTRMSATSLAFLALVTYRNYFPILILRVIIGFRHASQLISLFSYRNGKSYNLLCIFLTRHLQWFKVKYYGTDT